MARDGISRSARHPRLVRPRWGVALMLAGSAAVAASLPPRAEQIIQVPGFADFLVVDGPAVWVTNKGRVEHWSRQGKLAAVTMSHPCGAMAIAAGSLWVADCADRTVKRIDLATARITATVATGIARPDGELNVVAGAGSIWVASDAAGAVARIDPTTNRVIATIQVDPETSYLAFGFSSVWAVSGKNHSLQRIDPATNSVIKRTELGRQPGFLAAGEGAVWVQEQGDGTLARIDPTTGEVSGRVKIGDDLRYGDIDTGGGAVWLRTTANQTYVMVDPTSLAVLARIGNASGSGALRYTESGVWTTAHDVHTLSWWTVAPTATD